MSVKIDWDCAEAEGFDFALYSEELKKVFFTLKKPEIKYLNGERQYYDKLDGAYYPIEYYELLKRKEPKAEKQSVYTKEMHDAGELPEVGMDVMFEGDLCRIVLGLDKDDCYVVNFSGSWKFVDRNSIEPIDTRTDKEKAIDELKKLRHNNDSPSEFIEDAVDMIIEGRIPNIKYTGEK